MKIIAIGDLHGRGVWKYILSKNEDADKIVFIGDYWDSFDIPFEEQAKNFLDIIAYKKAHPERVVLLVGNHELHYCPLAMEMFEQYAGFQEKQAFLISHMLETNKEHLQMAWKHNDWLFTHAGVTQTWLKNTLGLGKTDSLTLELPIEEYINDVYKYTPVKFFFQGYDPYGDSVQSSPVWVRPASLTKNAYQADTLKQVVGHTGMKHLTVQKDRFFFIDTLGTSGEYLIIEDDKYRIAS